MAPPVLIAFDRGYDGPLRISVTLGKWEHDYDGAQLIELVEGLLLLGDRGAFVRADLHPVDARMRIVATRHQAPAHYIWDVDSRGVDHRFAQIFRNQLSMYVAVFCPVLQASLEMLQPPRPTTPRSLAPLDPVAVAAGHVYPERSTKLAFRVSHGDVVDAATERRAEIEFAGRFDDDMLATLREWFDLWARTLDCAYSATEERLANGKCAIWDYLTDIVDDVTVETVIGYWGAPERAWDSYVDLVGRVDAELIKVAELRLY